VGASDAVEASRLSDECLGNVNLLVTDIVLPGENGRTFAETLKRENPNLKVLLITGYLGQIARARVESEEYLVKPFSTSALLGKVRQILHGRQLRLEQGSEQAQVR
jgi:two-component system, cell cycle sensor histidine kinase and response regulator CckA